MRKFSKRLKKMYKDKKNDNCNPVPNQLVKCTFMMVFNNCPKAARNTSKPLLIHSVSYNKSVFYFLLSAEECTALQSGNNRKGNGNGKGHGKGNGNGNGNGNRGNQNKVNQKNRKQEMEKQVKAQDSSSSSSESESKETDITAAGSETTVEPQLERTTLSEVEIIDK
jgi:hypothetical protein